MLTRREFLLAALFVPPAAAILRAIRRDESPFVGGEVFSEIVRRVRDDHLDKLPIGLLTGDIGMMLQGTPYVGSTLELSEDREVCSVNLLGLDCVTFYEVALGLARMVRHGGTKPVDLLKEIQLTRYRGGKLDGYLSRLHYTSDWIDDNERKGVVTNLTPELPGASRMDKSFDFMSRHPQLYRQLRAHRELVPLMATIEKQISARRPWYVPNDRVAAIEPLLQTGDIVGIATTAAGLDCSHTGLIYVDEIQVRRFLNASSIKKQVVLGERLSEYATKYRNNLGVMIARPTPAA